MSIPSPLPPASPLPGQSALKPDRADQGNSKTNRITQLSCKIFQKLTDQQRDYQSGGELIGQTVQSRWLKSDGFFKSIPQIPPLTREQIFLRAEKMLALIVKTQELEPRLKCALPQLEDFTKRQTSILNKSGGGLPHCRKVHDKCRECLACIAKIWGYDSASWLEEALPTIGYCKNSNLNPGVDNRLPQSCLFSEEPKTAPFERLEPTLSVIQTVCNRAILCGNEKSLHAAIAYAPEQLIQNKIYASLKDLDWGFLQFFESSYPLAICLADSRRWSRLEFESFANYYGTNSAIHLQAISPAYDFMAEISDERRQRMLDITSFKSAQTPQKQLLDKLEQLSKAALNSIASHPLPPCQTETRMLFEIKEEKLALFSFGMSGWRVLPRIPSSTLDPPILHQNMHAQIERPKQSAFKNLQRAVSPFEAVSQLIFVRGGMSQEIKIFLMDFVNESEGYLKIRGDLMLDLEMLEAARSTFFVTEGISNRLDCFATWVMIATLTAHLFDVKLHLGCPINLSLAEIKETLLDLESQLCCCGLEKLTSEIDLVPQKEQVNMSLVLNPKAPGGGKLFLCEGVTTYRPVMARAENCCFSGQPERSSGETELEKRFDRGAGHEEISVFLYYSSLH